MSDIKKRMIESRKNRLLNLSKKTDFIYKDLTNNQEELLKYILNLSEDRQNLLLFKNYYNNTFDEIEDIFDIENAKGEYINLVCILSENLSIENAIISDNSIKKVCERAAIEINNEIMKDFNVYVDTETSQIPNTKRTLKILKSINRKVASVILFIFISSALILGSNAYAQGKIFEWIANNFEKYTSFNIVEENKINKNEVEIEIAYIPVGFKLDKKTIKNSVDIYYYKHKDKHIVIKIIYDRLKTGLNTENKNIEEFDIEGNKIKTWEKSSENYFVFTKCEIAYQIYGSIDKDEFIKIYDGILLNYK